MSAERSSRPLLQLKSTTSASYLERLSCKFHTSKITFTHYHQDAPEKEIAPGVKWLKVSYEDTAQLVQALEGVETVLSFITEMDNGESPIQKNLIDAAVRAKVKRFAPSEWST
jgi:hypothetical protein